MSVTGVWINQRGSIVTLREEPSGHIIGKYRSVVGRDLQVRDLSGRVSQPDGNKQMLGFTVCSEPTTPYRNLAVTLSVHGQGGYERRRW